MGGLQSSTPLGTSPPDGAMVAHGEAQVLPVLAHGLDALWRNARKTNEGGGVALPVGTQLAQLAEEAEREIPGLEIAVEEMLWEEVSRSGRCCPGLA